MRSLIIGAGEIGNSLWKVLSPHYYVLTIDKDSSYDANFEIIHICFPYSKDFVKYVKEYQKKYNPKYTVIHSTVPMEISNKCDAIFSPVIGKHPDLTESLTTFPKFLAGEDASEVANYFRRAGMKVILYSKSETAEFAKASQTTLYALIIEYIKWVDRECKKRDLSFHEVYTLPTMVYNQGYKDMGCPEYMFPLLNPIQTPQGGHCTINNLEFFNSPFTELIKKLNNS